MELNISRENVRALVIGEHGDIMVPLVEYVSVSGISITCLLPKEQIDKIVRLTIFSGSDVIKLKGDSDPWRERCGKILELELSNETRERFEKSVLTVKEALGKLSG